jgi:hypothetical protein
VEQPQVLFVIGPRLQKIDHPLAQPREGLDRRMQVDRLLGECDLKEELRD